LSSLFLLFLFSCSCHHPDLHSFPTRRSSDLLRAAAAVVVRDEQVIPAVALEHERRLDRTGLGLGVVDQDRARALGQRVPLLRLRSEEHTSELQSRENLVCRLLLEKKNI